MIETLNLTKKFDGLAAVDGLTLRVDEGEVFGFLGPNGATVIISMQTTPRTPVTRGKSPTSPLY